MEVIRNIQDLKINHPDFGKQIENLISHTDFKIEGIVSTTLVEDTIMIHVIQIQHYPKMIEPTEEGNKKYNNDQRLVEDRLRGFIDGGNPRPGVLWFFGSGTITITGYM